MCASCAVAVKMTQWLFPMACYVPVSFAYNKISPYSFVSAYLAKQLQLSVHQAAALLLHLSFDLLLCISDLGCEGVLWSDWFGLCQFVTMDGLTVFPPSSPECQLEYFAQIVSVFSEPPIPF